ncbi:MAG: hypothetical protein R2708_24430 [Vicinamibacterales bacterium]
MARTVAGYGGNHTSHVGSEGNEQAREIDYAIRVAAQAKVPVHIFHFKIRGLPLWGTIGKYITQIESARSRGLDVTANQYPYTAMFHGWSAFFRCGFAKAALTSSLSASRIPPPAGA